jgi:hypothetical protein
MTEEKEAFLDRWSRLKREQPEEKPVVPEAKQEPAAPLPPVEELKADSDFSTFMNPQVADETRRSALKKLFSDAHFNEPDLFEPYSADLSGGEPIPTEMLKALNQGRRLLFNEPEKASQAAAEPAARPEPPPQEAKDAAGKQDA